MTPPEVRQKPGKRVILAGLLLAFVTSCSPVLQTGGVGTFVPALGARDGDFPRRTDAPLAARMRDGALLPVRVWSPADFLHPAPDAPAGIVLALHGFNDSANAFRIPGRGLARRGYWVYAPDQRGFGATAQRGLWAGTDRMIGDVQDLAALLRARHPGLPLYLLGESMGGALLMAAAHAGQLPPDVAGVILSAPAIWGRQSQSAFNRHVLDAAAHLVPWLTVVPVGLRVAASDNPAALRAMARDPLIIRQTRVDAAWWLVDLMSLAWDAGPSLAQAGPPVLILFGGREAVQDKGAVGGFLDRLKAHEASGGTGVRVISYPGGHHLLLRDRHASRIHQDLVDWMRDPDADLSGAGPAADGPVQ